MQSGEQAIRVLHRGGDGQFEELDAAAAGLKVTGHAVACAVGDFDGDNLNDLAVALDDGVRLFRNLGQGQVSGRDGGGGPEPRAIGRRASRLLISTTTAIWICC